MYAQRPALPSRSLSAYYRQMEAGNLWTDCARRFRDTSIACHSRARVRSAQKISRGHRRVCSHRLRLFILKAQSFGFSVISKVEGEWPKTCLAKQHYQSTWLVFSLKLIREPVTYNRDSSCGASAEDFTTSSSLILSLKDHDCITHNYSNNYYVPRQDKV